MPKKFSGFQNQGVATPGVVRAADETVLIVRYSQSVPYINIVEENNKPIIALQALSVMLQLAMKFLVALTEERSMLVGQGGKNDGTEKKDGG